MWIYEKRLQHPVKISQRNPKLAQVIISQFGGPDCNNREQIHYNKKKARLISRRANSFYHSIHA